MGVVVLFASTSGIAQAVAEELLQRKRSIVLAARNQEMLARQAQDLAIKFDLPAASIPTMVWDLTDEHSALVDKLWQHHDVEGVIIAAGVMPPQDQCEREPDVTAATIQLNFTQISVLLNLFAERLIQRGSGFLSVMSSVAGDRGRQSNYVYGAAKAGLNAYLEGLRNRLHKHNILVQTVKPGPVKTPMTAHLKESPLMADPAQVARDIVDAIERRQDVVYTPFYWRYIMSLIRWIPEPLFKRLSL